MNKVLIFATIIFLTACASDRFSAVERVSKIAEMQGLSVKIYHTKTFDIFTLQKISDTKKPLRIYIEGDGRAYINKYQPSLDPTPRTDFLIKMIAQDDSPNILYIARPCQYVDDKNCAEKYWTSQRFSAEAIAAISEVVDDFSNQKLELIGYSGGGLIALQLSQKNIKNIRTIAGNLDLEKFVAIHKISELTTVDIDYKRLATIPQIHFIGEKDKIIPQEIFEEYQKKLPQKNLVKMKIVPNAEHQRNWQEEWRGLLREGV